MHQFREETEREKEMGHPANRSESTANTLMFMFLFLSITSLFEKNVSECQAASARRAALFKTDIRVWVQAASAASDVGVC